MSDQPETVGAVSKPRQHLDGSSRGARQKTGRRCFRCNREGHLSSSKECPAIGRICNACNKKGHFASARFCNGSTSVSNASAELQDDGQAREDDSQNLFTVQQIASRMPKCDVTIDINTYNRLRRNISLTLDNADQHSLFALWQYKSFRCVGDIQCKGLLWW